MTGDASWQGTGSTDSRRPISTESVVVAAQDQVSADLAGETIILGLTAGAYFGLEDVGGRIWDLIREPRTVAEIRDTIVEEYDVDVDRCERELLGLLEQLATTGLIEIRHGENP